jgi:hypothetical protein
MEVEQGASGKKYSWVMKGKKVKCFKGNGSCTVTALWETEGLTVFHDAQLASATKEINAIVEKIQKNNQDSKRTLSAIEYQGRHFLVWSTCGDVTPDDDDATIIKALKLKSK